MPLDVDVFVIISSDPAQRCPLAILFDDLLDFELKATETNTAVKYPT